MPKKHVVKLTREERQELEQLVKKGKAAGWKLQRAQALLKCDQGPDGPGWTDEQIAEAFGCTTRSLESWRKQAVDQGPLSLLARKPRVTPAIARKLDGEKEARLTALACSQAPPGHARWTLRLLADRLVELEIVDSISPVRVYRAMKKTTLSPGVSKCGVFRPNRTPPLFARWNKCSRSTGVRTIPNGR